MKANWGRVAEYGFFGFIALLLQGAACSGSSAKTPNPPRTVHSSSFAIFEANEYKPDPSCDVDIEDKWNPVALKLTATLRSEGWTGGYFDNNSMEPAHWFDQDQVTCGPYGRCWDDIGADSSRFTMYVGHGAYPDILPNPQAFRVFNIPHMTLWFPQKRIYAGPTGPIGVCGVRLTDPTSPPLDYDSWLGAGSGASATHLVFVSSCTAQPRLVERFMLLNRTSQVMGFMYSPLIDSGATPVSILTSESIDKFYIDTLEISNAASWMLNVGSVQREAGGFAGAIAHTFSSRNDADGYADDFGISLPTSQSLMHMLRAGQQVDRQLPLVSPNPNYPWSESEMTHQSFMDLCQPDNCGVPTLDCLGNGTQPLESTPTRFAGGSASRFIPSQITGAAVGHKTPVVTVTTPRPDVDAVSGAALSLAQVMTGESHDPAIAKNLVAQNIAVGDWRFGELSENMFIGYDPIRARLRLFNPYPPELLDSNGKITSIGWSEAERIVSDLLDNLSAAGLPGKRYWTTDAPLLSHFGEKLSDGTLRTWGYQYTIFRKVNGSPVRAIPLTVIVHRSGKIAYLALSGRGVNTHGEAGSESNDTTPQTLLIPVDVARAKFYERKGNVQVHSIDLRYEMSRGAAQVDCEGGTCFEMRNVFVVTYSSVAVDEEGRPRSATAPPVRTVKVDALSGEVYED